MENSNLVKKHKVKLIIYALTLSLILFFIILFSYELIMEYKLHKLNRQGYCQTTGRKITFEERVNLALDEFMIKQNGISNDLLNKYITSYKEKREDGYPIPSSTDIPESFDRIILYKNKAEFIQENPRCCTKVQGTMNSGPQSEDDKNNGLGDGYIHLVYKIKYLTRTGEQKSFLVDDVYYKVTNCGAIYNITDVSCLYYKRLSKHHQNDVCNYN